ncbi:MAG: DUF4192 domain-containing protein [Mycobacterium sp.]
MFNTAALASLITSIPALLGFVPEHSWILVPIADGAVGTVMRVDLGEHTAEVSERLAAVAADHEADSAILVVVDPHGGDHADLVEVLAHELTIRGIRMAGAVAVDDITGGGRWHCLDGCGAGGTLEDPAAGILAAAAVLDGRRLYRNRGEMQSLVAQDPTTVERVSAVLAADSVPADPREAVESIIATARAFANGAVPADADIAYAATALLDSQVRDMLLAFALTGDSHAAEDFWSMLARSVPTPWRVEALALLAVYAYVRADGPLAGIALEAALQDDPWHALASMLDFALQSAMQPSDIRSLAEVGYRVAREAGVNLPTQLEETA